MLFYMKAQRSFRQFVTQAFGGGEVEEREARESKYYILLKVTQVFLSPKDLLQKIVF